MTKILKRLKGQIWQRLVNYVPWNGQVSFSQFGEDMVIDWLTRGQLSGFYVDIGAFHPVALSNTYSLYCRGWRGVNIEPRSEVIQEFESFRRGDVNLAIAIACDKAKPVLPLYIFAQGEYSTLDEGRARQLEAQGHRLLNTVEVSVRTLADVLTEYAPTGKVDFLNIDVEGLDEAVLRGNDWDRFRPRIIAVERHGLSYEDAVKDSVVESLKEMDYRLVAKCGPTLILECRWESN